MGHIQNITINMHSFRSTIFVSFVLGPWYLGTGFRELGVTEIPEGFTVTLKGW